MADKTPQSRDELEETVKQQVMLSLGLEPAEKESLIQKLPTLAIEQLNQLKDIFNEENQLKEKLLSDFFAKNPQLYPEFERFSKEQVNSIYRGVEETERKDEVSRMEKLANSSY